MAERFLFRVKIRNPRRIRATIARAVKRQQGLRGRKLVMVARVREGLGNEADKSAKHQDLVMKCRKVSWYET